MNILTINNNQNKTNFQALRISPKLAQTLEAKSPEYIKKLSSIGEELKTVKKFHVLLDDTFTTTPKVIANDPIKYGHRDYFHELKYEIEPKLGKTYYETAGDETVSGTNPKVPKVFSEIYGKNSKSKYEEFTKLDELEQAAEYSKLWDEAITKRELKEIAERQAENQRIQEELAKKEAHKKSISELLNKFGISAETNNIDKPKKKFWFIPIN